jgi:NADPH:quinone reductase
MPQTYGRFVVRQPGGVDALEWVEETLPEPGPSEISIRQEAVSVDFIDTQLRAGRMPADLPTGIGFSAAGRVVAVGSGVDGIAEGDRVAYSWAVPGAYAEMRNVPSERVIRLPDQTMPAATAAGALFRGLTAWYLATRLRPIEPGDAVLVHAAAGGVGQILTQWLKHLGAVVIATVGSPAKAEALRGRGPDHVLLQSDDFVTAVQEITGGKGCAIVYDSVGKDTFDRSLQAAARFGLVVSFGWASGDPGTVSLPDLRNRGSLFVTRPTISHYTAEAGDFRAGADALFRLVTEGAIRIETGSTYPLREAARAHDDLVGRRTTGSVVLTV